MAPVSGEGLVAFDSQPHQTCIRPLLYQWPTSWKKYMTIRQITNHIFTRGCLVSKGIYTKKNMTGAHVVSRYNNCVPLRRKASLEVVSLSEKDFSGGTSFLSICLESNNASVSPFDTRVHNCGDSSINIHDVYKLERLRSFDLLSAMARILCPLSVSKRVHGCVSTFDAVRIPSIRVQDYFVRLVDFFNCSASCHIVSLVYIVRLVRAHPQFPVDSLNIHRLLITATVLAAKFYDDKFLSNGYYAQVGGVSTREINRLEVQFLEMLDYRLVVSPQEFETHANSIMIGSGLLI